ncbi:hypothetical protein AKJ50_01170 [candidate division MSBL1 archaeon SCGC-AAA382A13]|uniref:DNA-directed DNA polymerase n=1 Tax=candidate division MSBL1 archaeon SCGC-AAA382A13 TaxID=1698279 RepID=A0A133VG13_9EURY|nr:hypothetical protein AKJ50_01170 [candidate division MSBL1 archaeon SCGC-AAA382A13]
MDSFFASIEANRRNIKNEPIIVCVYSGRSEDSGAVSTSSYEARKYGIEAGMSIKRAKKIAQKQEEKTGKKFHFLPIDKDYYKQFSFEIKENILTDFSQKIEQASIDEYYLDLTKEVNDWEEAEKLSSLIKKRIKEEFGLTCSIGIGPNKLIAKIASNQNKPDGITIVPETKTEEFIQSLELEDIHGIGKKTLKRLSKLGITSVKELAEARLQPLRDEFGEKLGQKLIKKAKGEGDIEVREKEQKQLSRITTLKKNSNDFEYIEKYLEELATELIRKADEKNLLFKKVILITIDTNLQMRTKSETLTVPVKDKNILLETGKNILKRFLKDFEGQIRRIGLRISDFKKREGQKQLSDYN